MRVVRTILVASFLALVGFATSGCTAVGAGTGAVVGGAITDTPAGVVGGAVVGGVIGHEMGK